MRIETSSNFGAFRRQIDTRLSRDVLPKLADKAARKLARSEQGRRTQRPRTAARKAAVDAIYAEDE